jgi:hypothetical protein
MRIRIQDPKSFFEPGSDPGWKNSDPGSRINIQDQQHYCIFFRVKTILIRVDLNLFLICASVWTGR